MPDWVDQAVKEYSKRLQESVALHVIEIPLLKRNKSSNLSRILEKEEQKIRDHIPNGAHRIALDITGKSFSSEQLAKKIERLQNVSSHWCFLIGGPEGLPASVVDACEERWSLSHLTLPHTIARIVLLEAIYRAFSITQNHPYHK